MLFIFFKGQKIVSKININKGQAILINILSSAASLKKLIALFFPKVHINMDRILIQSANDKKIFALNKQLSSLKRQPPSQFCFTELNIFKNINLLIVRLCCLPKIKQIGNPVCHVYGQRYSPFYASPNGSIGSNRPSCFQCCFSVITNSTF